MTFGKKNATKLGMPVEVTIRYPELSGEVSADAREILQRFESVLCDEMVKVMCSTSNYRWEFAPEFESDLYFKLVKTYDDTVVITIGLRELSQLKPVDLIDRIRVLQVFPEPGSDSKDQ